MTDIIALTGGIASGKTTICSLFVKNYHIPIIDTDIIARHLLTTDKALLQQLNQQFNQQLLDQQGQLKRQKLRDIIFSHQHQRQKLNQLLHPKIYQQVVIQIQKISQQYMYCIIAIPLLIETFSMSQEYLNIQRVIVIDCDQKTQIQRVMQRDHISQQQASKILKIQASRIQRLEIADDIIYNDQNMQHLQQQVDLLHNSYQILL